MKPGDEALLFIPRPRLRVRAVRVRRVWQSVAGTQRVEVQDADIRPGASFDSRQFLPLAVLENLPASPASTCATHKMAAAGGA